MIISCMLFLFILTLNATVAVKFNVIKPSLESLDNTEAVYDALRVGRRSEDEESEEWIPPHPNWKNMLQYQKNGQYGSLLRPGIRFRNWLYGNLRRTKNF